MTRLRRPIYSVSEQSSLIIAEAANTAKFIGKFDKVFNVFNSRTFSSKAELNHAITNTSGHVEFLKEFLEWLKPLVPRILLLTDTFEEYAMPMFEQLRRALLYVFEKSFRAVSNLKNLS